MRWARILSPWLAAVAAFSIDAATAEPASERYQLDRLVPVHKVSDLTIEGPHVERELALIKVAGDREQRVQALRIADFMHARLVDSAKDSFVFEITGASTEIDAFIDLMEPLGLAEVSRAGVVAIARGAKGM